MIGAPFVTEVLETVVPLPAVTVQVPALTERFVVGLDPAAPARVSVTVVWVAAALYPVVTVALSGEATAEAMEYALATVTA